MALSKTAIEAKGKAFLKASGKSACLVTLDGSIFPEDGRGYAESRARDLVKQGYEYDVVTVKAGKEDSKPAPKAEEKKAEPEAKPKATKAPAKKGTSKKAKK